MTYKETLYFVGIDVDKIVAKYNAKGLLFQEKEAIKKMGRYAGLTALGTLIILSPK